MRTFEMTIDGNAVGGASSFSVLNPATLEVVAEAPDCSRHDLDRALEAASSAYGTWRRDEPARRACLEKAADLLVSNAGDLSAVITAEQGKPLKDSMAEITGSAHWLRYFAGLEIPVDVVKDDKRGRARVFRRPLGVVAAITPWNFPIFLAASKLGPALLAGNTVVLKPSPFTPLSTLAIGAVLADALPPGVLNTVSGGNELGEWMTTHPATSKVSFTGSVATGKRVAAAVAPDLKRMTLELGGNDAAIILDDAEPEKIASDLFWGAFNNNGQTCSAIKRVYVHKSLYGELAEALAAVARATRVGNGEDEDVELGPINNLPQLERVTGLVDAAVSAGAKVAAGGHRMNRPGYFFQPTILTDLSEGTGIVDEEQFGPALPVLPYRDLDDAISRANATRFGLSGSVWGSDPERALSVAEKLECGTAWVNTHLALAPYLPFGGAKWSGIGVENGPWGLDGFSGLRVVYEAR